MEKFFIWLLPEKREVYISDKDDIPVYAMNLSKLQIELVTGLGGNKSFDSWKIATAYGERIARNMHWRVMYETENGKKVKLFINNGVFQNKRS
jgi:hypothetical protein